MEKVNQLVFFLLFFFAFNFTPICALFQGTYIVLQTINDCIYMKSKISIQEESQESQELFYFILFYEH